MRANLTSTGVRRTTIGRRLLNLRDRMRERHRRRWAYFFIKELAIEVVWRDRRRVAWWHLRSAVRSRWLRAKEARLAAVCGESSSVFDLRAYNPIRWRQGISDEVATLGPVEELPPGTDAHRIIRRRDLRRLRQMHHVEDVQAFHSDVAIRAGELTRLAACGVVVHLADCDERLRSLLGEDLYRLMTAEVRGIDADARELLSIRMRRAALRDHSSWARTRQFVPKKFPLVSALLVTRRPEFLAYALNSVARQTYPNLELILALHGEGFVDVERQLAGLQCAVKTLRIHGSEPLGAALNAAVEASEGALLTKMDDDDVYGADHVWDLALAREYSGAQLVGKFHEFVYLASLDLTVHRLDGGNERYLTKTLDGGTLLISRQDLESVGGWRRVPRHVDEALCRDVVAAGGRLYRTHGAGFMLVRHGRRHTWEMSDDYFLAQADDVSDGWSPELAGIDDLNLPYPALMRRLAGH